MKPMVSYILPAFNAERFLADAIASIRVQDHAPYEIIVVDDGSKDETAEVARAFDDVRLFQQENQGAAAARNHAIRESRGVLLSFVDADDALMPGKTRKQVDHLLSRPELGGCIGLMENFVEGTDVMPQWAEVNSRNGELMALNSLVVWREVFLRVGFIDEKMRVGSDFEWMIRSRDLGVQVDILREVFIKRRVHGENLSRSGGAQRRMLLHSFKASLDRRRASGPKD